MTTTTSQRKLDIEKAVRECKEIANSYLSSWKPVDPKWKTIEGCAYLRLSTDDQVLVEKGSLEQQVYMAINEAESRSKQKQKNYKITHFYIEPGVSGRKHNRKEFLALKRAIRIGEHNFVAFKELSRIARDSQIWKEFFRLCQSKNCEIVIRGLPIDPNDPSQCLQLDILAAFAEYEAQQTAKRIKDSVFSAMRTSGKFNATHRVLGLDTLTINGVRKPGFYQVNEEEMAHVRWIMETFVKYGSHQKTLEYCNERNIKNWNGEPFHRHSLIQLLTNPKYIGKWYLNEENRYEDQESLPDQQRYYEIDLPHGAVVPMDLWDNVQKAVKLIAGNMGKNTRVKRVYLLSGGLLKLHDGTNFGGMNGNGATQTSYYYFNSKNNLRIKAEAIEEDALRMLTKLIEKSPEVEEGIAEYGNETQDNIQFLQQRIKELGSALESVEHQKKQQLKKMDILIGGDSTPEEVALFRQEFKSLLERLNSEKELLGQQLLSAEAELRALEQSSFSWKSIAEHADNIHGLAKESDPVALKRALKTIFKEVVVGPEDSLGRRTISYVLSPELVGLLEDEVRNTSEVVETVGIEPTSERTPSPRPTCLVCVLS